MKYLLSAALLLQVLTGRAQMTLENLDIGFSSGQVPQKEYVYEREKLKLYVIKGKPSLAKAIDDKTDYIPLETAITKDMVQVTEVSQGGEVNQLLFENKSKSTVILQMGDVITGGKQDRVVLEEKILKPGEKSFVGVYCVEQGRWNSGDAGTAQFKAYHSKISNDVRRTMVKEQSQQAVWRDVAKVNSKNKTGSSSGTYAAISKNGDNQKEIRQYVDFYLRSFKGSKDIVGLLAVSGDQVIGCDIFGTPELFQANVQQMLHSYATEAVLNGSAVTISDAAVNDYLDELLENEEKQAEILKRKGAHLKSNGKNLKISAF
ncbi:MAG: hypothetical protein EOP54_04470 [Sphingobacteriales bacterium]|nr:MAG: hypothetical protein EOP54_04470 [Sphingobacteriales bacterium]